MSGPYIATRADLEGMRSELSRLRESHSELLAAAKEAVKQLSPVQNISVFDFVVLKHLLDEAIRKSEELAL